MKNDGNQTKGVTCLFLASLIWGTAFVAQRVGMDYVGPFTFNAVRSLIGAAALIPVIFLLRSIRRRGRTQSGSQSGLQADAAIVRPAPDRMSAQEWKNLLQGGALSGIFLCAASNLQQAGIQYTTVGKAGFITALYIVGVPILGMLLGKKVGWRIWISVAAAVVGLYLLCMTEKLTINRGDLMELGCAAAFAVQILAVDRYSHLTEGAMLSCVQFFVSGSISAVLMLLTEEVNLQALWQARIPILYAGVLSCGVAYTLQILGQRELRPALASLIMSFEAVISAIAGWLLLGQRLSTKEIAGCVVMFAAILLAQMPDRIGTAKNGTEAA